MIVNNTQRGIIYIPVMSGTTQVSKLVLLPGNNEVKDADWKGVKKSETVKRKLASKQLKEVAVKEKEVDVEKVEEVKDEETGKVSKKKTKVKEKVTEPVPFSELDIDKAEEIVKETYNTKTLEDWKKSEVRDSVRLAIMNKLEEIEEHGSKKKD